MPHHQPLYRISSTYILAIVFIFIGFFSPYNGSSQNLVELYVKDEASGFNQPFVKITNLMDSSEALSGINGIFQASPGDRLLFEHFLYETKTYTVDGSDSLQIVYLKRRKIKDLDLSQDSLGRAIFRQFQDTMLIKGYKLLPYLKYELVNDLQLYSTKRSKEFKRDLNDWERYLTLISIEENISEGPRKNKLRVVFSKTETQDSTIITQNSTTLIPGYLQNISPLNEYISLDSEELSRLFNI